MTDNDTNCKICGFLEFAHPGDGTYEVCDSFTAEWKPRIRFPEFDEPPTGEVPGRAAFQATYDPTRDSIWLEIPDDDWTVAHRLMVQGGQLVLAEIRFFPTDLQGSYFGGPGEWSEEGIAPPGGITARRLREKLKVGAHMELAETIFEGIRLRMGDEEYEKLFGPLGIPAEATRRVGRRRLRKGEDPKVRQARLSAAYDRKVRAGSKKPVVEIAKEERLSRDTVRDLLHDARHNEYLTKPPRKGVVGGRLTQKGLEILRLAGLIPTDTETEEGDKT